MKIKLDPGAYVPERAHATDAGLDIYSPCDIKLRWLKPVTIMTGVHIDLESASCEFWTCGFVKNRSSMFKRGIITDGTIDMGYTGEIGVTLISLVPFQKKILKGDRIAQLVIPIIGLVPIEIVERLGETERGANGFGSTGR